MKQYRLFSQLELDLLRAIGHCSRLSDLSRVMERPASSILRAMQRNSILTRKPGVAPLSYYAVSEAWRLLKIGMRPHRGLAYWPQNRGRRHASADKLWSRGDIDLLHELIGTHSLEQIACALRRRRGAVVTKARRLGLLDQAYQYTCPKLAVLLRVHPATVNGWCQREGPDAEGNYSPPKVESWREGAWRVVHRIDAEWLLDNFRWGDTNWAGLAELKEELNGTAK